MENKEICSKCGGMCCKKSGCDYQASDLPSLNKKDIMKFLESGRASIVAALDFYRDSRGNLIMNPFLYLRARNKGRGIVDLFSLKKRCTLLTDTGCSLSYEERPFGGKNLIPYEDKPCYPDKNPLDIMMTWKPYQSLLSKLVKFYTGNSVSVQMEQDVEQLFRELKGPLDDVSPIELADMVSMLHELVEAYPEAYRRVNPVNVLLQKKHSK